MNVKERLIQLQLFELLSFVKSLYLKRRYMLLSYESVLHAERRLEEKMQTIKAEKEKELVEKGSTSWGVDDRARWNVDIEGFNVDIIDYVNKSSLDFFHYSRMCLDMIPQILNIAAFEPKQRKSKESVSYDVIKELPNSYKKIASLLQRISKDEKYKYLIDVDNYLKHIDIIDIKLKTKNVLEDFDSFVLNGFSYQSKQYGEKEIIGTIGEIKEFVTNAVDDFFGLLLNDIKATKRKNQITDIMYESLMDGRVLNYLSFFIEVPTECQDAVAFFDSELIYVHPLTVDKSYHIYEDSKFDFDTIFIRQEETGRIIGKAIGIGDDDDSFYKSYRIEISNDTEYKEYIINFRDNYKFRETFNVMAFCGIERRVLHKDGQYA